jgi:hypothetical protein
MRAISYFQATTQTVQAGTFWIFAFGACAPSDDVDASPTATSSSGQHGTTTSTSSATAVDGGGTINGGDVTTNDVGSGHGSSSGSTVDDGSGSSGGSHIGQPLPFIVDEHFTPSGYMGDGAEPGNITMTPTSPEDTTTCDGDRAHAGAVGNCHRIAYAPASQNWGGIYWQYPPDNWGELPGFSVEPGATRVIFYAKGDAGNEPLLFIAGGIQGDMQNYQDTFYTETFVVLDTQWTQYDMDLVGQDYDEGVLGGFAWVVDGTMTDGPVVFYIDDIRWE